MVTLLDAMFLVLVYAGASMVQENEELNAGVHVGSAFITAILSCAAPIVLALAPSILDAAQYRPWIETIAVVTIAAIAAWFVASILVRWLYGASDMTANRMAIIVGAGQVLALLLARSLILSTGVYAPVDVTQ